MVPRDLQYIVIPQQNNAADGSKIDDYYSNNMQFGVGAISLPVIKQEALKKVEPFIEYMNLILVGLIVLSIVLFTLIDILITLENSTMIKVLKTIGYSKKEIYILISSMYIIVSLISLILSFAFSILIIKLMSPIIVSKVEIGLRPNFNILSIMLPIGFVLFTNFVLWLFLFGMYKKSTK